MPLRSIARPSAQQREAALQAEEQSGRGQQLDAGRGEPDRQRETVETDADRRNGGRIRRGEPEVTRYGPSAFHEQRDRRDACQFRRRVCRRSGRERQRLHDQHLLPADVERLPARDEDLQSGTGSEQVRQGRSDRHKMLSVVEQEKRVAVTQSGDHGLDHRPLALLAQPEGVGDRGQHER